MNAFSESLAYLRGRRAVCLWNNHLLARQIVKDLCEELGVSTVIKRVDQYTDLRAFLGDPQDHLSFELTEFHRAAQKGGLVLFEVLESSPKVSKELQLLEPLLPRGSSTWSIPDYDNFCSKNVHPDFHIVLSTQSDPKFLHPSVSSRLEVIKLESGVGANAHPSTTMGTALGPSDVLVLMKFGIEEYEEWYQDVLLPLISKFGKCIRMEGTLEDWQSNVSRAIDRADAVIADLSHDLTNEISDNVLWEVNRLWQSFYGVHPDFVKRKKLILIARGLENIKSHHPNSDFVFHSEIGKDWINNMPKVASNIEDLLGFEVRRYSIERNEINRFIGWLEGRLRNLVQRLPAPVSDVELMRHAQELRNGSELSAAETMWLQAISERDFESCVELLDSHDVPTTIVPILGELMTTVTVSQSFETPGYWRLSKKAIKGSKILRQHYRTLLVTDQLSKCDPVSDPANSSFCENVWFAFIGIGSKLPSDEKEELVKLAELETRMTIRGVSDTFRYNFLPEDEKHDVLANLLREHLEAAWKEETDQRPKTK